MADSGKSFPHQKRKTATAWPISTQPDECRRHTPINTEPARLFTHEGRPEADALFHAVISARDDTVEARF